MAIKLCELCSGEAAVYCAADSAFLCIGCDDRVHAANFLVARHVRQLVCPNCNSVSDNCVSGSLPPRGLEFGNGFCCKSCSSLPSSSTSSLECVSSCESSSTAAGERGRKPIRSKKSRKAKEIRNRREAEGVFATWCEKLGLSGSFKSSVITSASLALSLCMERLTPVLPFKVSFAASFWFGVRISRSRSAVATWRNLKSLEEISGVPSRLILAVETRVARALRSRNPPVNPEEGSAESHGV